MRQFMVLVSFMLCPVSLCFGNADAPYLALIARIRFPNRTLSSILITMADAHAPKAESPIPREKLEAQIKSADMTEDMQQESIEVAQEAMAKFTIEKDIAQHIKRTFDERKGPTWHCIVGRNFGSFVTHETKHFIYFYLGHCAILLFKTQ
ncbi:hypothetical protein FPSE5266_11666 [Fusarium pseudograminearum]|nr:hypothetical protein FPSE5266_11666 [Fusarium pseudograminearum]